jgi:WD40 repeat protein
LEEIRNQIDTFKSLTENPFSLKMNYIDIPTTFREVIRTIGHEGPINCLSRIGDSQFISGSSDLSIKFWNLEDEELKPYECINKYTGEIGCILLLRDNRLCYTSLKDSWIKISEKIKTFSKGDEMNNSEDKYKVANTLSEHTKSITGLIQLDNNNLVSASRDDKIIVWQMVEDDFIKSFELKDVHFCNNDKEKTGVYSLCKLDSNNFISGGADGNIKFWENINKNEYKCIQEFGEHKDKVRNLVLLKDDYLCSASDDGFVKVWTKKDKKYQLYWEKEIKDELITCLAGLKNGILITGSSSKNHGIYANMRVWEKIGNEYCLKENIKKDLKKITAVMELDWGNVVSTGEDGVIIIWKSGVLYD